jgi:mannose-1-phosphate guanylyltransferase/mannose-6-phosphate isomerase
MSSRHAVIMAGGAGTRLWPLGRRSRPKQFLPLVDGERSLLKASGDRLHGLIPEQQIHVVAGTEQKKDAEVAFGAMGARFIAEPEGRNTAPCIGLACAWLLRADPDAMVAILPADHWIKDEDQFRSTLARAFDVAAVSGRIVTIGIVPDHAATGFGYLQLDGEENDHGVPLSAFIEKPSGTEAKRMLAAGGYLWNAGMFVARARTLLEEISRQMPSTGKALKRIAEAMGSDSYDEVLVREYANCEAISIDYGVMENAADVWAVPGRFGWSDVGSWDALGEVRANDDQGNAVKGSAVMLDCTNCVVDVADGVTVALADLDNMVVSVTSDAVLVLPRGSSQRVKELLGALVKKGREDLQ